MTKEDRNEPDDDGRWWRLDFTMVLVLLVCLTVLLIITFEFWHPHFGFH